MKTKEQIQEMLTTLVDDLDKRDIAMKQDIGNGIDIDITMI